MAFLAVVDPIEKESRVDGFGVTKLYATQPHGMAWVSTWGYPRSMSEDDTTDPKDPWFTVTENSATYKVTGGELWISGRAPRMYVRDPALKRQWRNVEITMYFKRVSDDSTAFAGMVGVTRANHGATGPVESDSCDSQGYGGRMRYDGYTDFEREIAHPRNDSTEPKLLWPGGMPYDVWLGYKYVVYDLPDSSVQLQLWLDPGNGQWRMVDQLRDSGTTFGQAMVACRPGTSSSAPLNGTGKRKGSESGKPNISTYFRTDNVTSNGGLRYKWGSIREIKPERLKS
jgi:hypothetical protein